MEYSRKGGDMKKFLLVTLLILLVTMTAVFAAQPREGFGVGLSLQAPFGVGAVAEYNFGVASANASIGYVFNAFHIGLGGDYILPGLFENSALGLDLQASVGGKLDMGFVKGATILGIGFPISLSYYMESIPLKIFTRAVPEFIMILGVGFDLGMRGEVGAMYLL